MSNLDSTKVEILSIMRFGANMTEETITITTKRFIELLEAERVLNALYAGGVDNWEWYGDSLDNLAD